MQGVDPMALMMREQFAAGYQAGMEAMIASVMVGGHYIVTACLIVAVYKLYKDK